LCGTTFILVFHQRILHTHISCQAGVSNVTSVLFLSEVLPSPAAAAFDATKYCCRQPWHDIHAKVEGPAAMDICLNCE
jgi:hypothetical protein